MRDEIRLVFGEDGKAREYDDTYDVIIHCETEEEQEAVVKHLESMTWIPYSERLPEEWQTCIVCNKGQIAIDTFIGHDKPWRWNLSSGDYEAWMPLPEPYRGANE